MSVDTTRSSAFTFCTTDSGNAITVKKRGSGAQSFGAGLETEYRFQTGLETWGDNNVGGDIKVDNNAGGDNKVDNKVDIKVDNNKWVDTVNETVKHPQIRTRTITPYNTRTTRLQGRQRRSFGAALILMILTVVGLNVCGAQRGSCERGAEQLAAGEYRRNIRLVKEYDPDFNEYYDDSGCYYFKIVCRKGQAYTVVATDGMGIYGMDIYSDYDQEVVDARFDCGEDMYAENYRGILRMEDWSEDDPDNVTYYVRIEGEVGAVADVTFHMGVKEEILPFGAEENPLGIGSRYVGSFTQLKTGEFWFRANLQSGCKYIVETMSNASIDFPDFHGTVRFVDLDSGEVRYELYSDNRCVLVFPVCSEPYSQTTIRYWQVPSRAPGQHEFKSLQTGNPVTFSPGKINADGSGYYDNVIDECLFSISVEADKPYKISTSGAATNLLMVIYDFKGEEFVKRESEPGTLTFDVAASFAFPVSRTYYVGIAEKLVDEMTEMPSGGMITLTLDEIDSQAEEENVIRFRAISFDAAGGTCSEPTRIAPAGQVIGVLPVPTKPLCSFLGWFSETDGGDQILQTDVVVSNKVCYARWKPILRFASNCGQDEFSGMMEDVVLDSGEEIEIPDCGFVREGRTFTGWATMPNGAVEYFAGDRIALDEGLMLYAIWDGPPQYVINEETGILEYMELNGASEVHIPDSVKSIPFGLFDGIPESLFDTNSIPCLMLLDGWVVGITDDYWNTYGTGEEDAPYWELDLSVVRGVVDNAFWPGDLRVSSLVATQQVLDWGVSGTFGDAVSSVTIADGTTYIPQCAMSGLKNLTNVVIATSVSRIEENAFADCPNLKSLTFGNSIMTAQWMEQFPRFEEKFGNDFAKAVTAWTGKTDGTYAPMLVWQDYVAGTDPTDENDIFKASITLVDGVPQVSYTPELPEAETAKRKYTTYGKARLQDEEWHVVDGDAASYNFFKVTVEMR